MRRKRLCMRREAGKPIALWRDAGTDLFADSDGATRIAESKTARLAASASGVVLRERLMMTSAALQ